MSRLKLRCGLWIPDLLSKNDSMCESLFWLHLWADLEGGAQSGPPPPQKNHKNIGFLSETGPDHLKNHKATKPAFNAGSSSARQRFVGGR